MAAVVVDSCVFSANPGNYIPCVAPTEAVQIISAAGDTLSVPAPVVQHEELMKTGHPETGEGKPKPATSGSSIICVCGFINYVFIRTMYCLGNC